MKAINLKVRQAFLLIFSWPQVVNKAYYFVAVPFLTALLLILVQSLSGGNQVILIIGVLVVLLINFVYQLYLWTVSFFYAQQISEHDWGEYVLNLQEIFSDWWVKSRLILIRLVWQGPMFLIYILLLLQSAGLNTYTTISSIPQAAIAVVAGYSVIQIIVEVFLVSTSNFIYSETGSVLLAINPLMVFRLLKRSIWEYLLLFLLQLLAMSVFGILLLVLGVLLMIPIIGGLALGLITGLNTVFQVMFMANLQGQIWSKLRPELEKING